VVDVCRVLVEAPFGVNANVIGTLVRVLLVGDMAERVMELPLGEIGYGAAQLIATEDDASPFT
jgi:hypothetical protein